MFVALREKRVLDDVLADLDVLFEPMGHVLAAQLVKVYPTVHVEAGIDHSSTPHVHVT